MALSLNEYVKFFCGKNNATRVVLFPNIEQGAKLVNFHKEQGHYEIVVGKLIDENHDSFPMPGVIIRKIQATAETVEGPSFVTGIDAYLLLLNANKADDFYAAIQALVDQNKFPITFILSSNNNIKFAFVNPKYVDGMQLVAIEGEPTPLSPIDITLIPSEWGRSAIAGLKGLLGALGNLIPNATESGYTVAVSNYKLKIAGMSEHIAQCVSPLEYLKSKGCDVLISNEAAIKLIAKDESPLETLEKQFGEEYINPRLGLKRLLEVEDDLWHAYIWMLIKRLSSATYLVAVLLKGQTKETLFRNYVVTCALFYIETTCDIRFARERAEALREIGDDSFPLIAEFVSAVEHQEDVGVLPWLCVGTDSEKQEIVRRAAKSDFTVGLHAMYAKAYPALGDYFINYSVGDSIMSDYFFEYRKCKIQNAVTQEFVKIAYEIEIPSTICSRDIVLQDYATDVDTALLVVDGMSAEYFSLLIGSANRKGISIVSAKLVSVKWPTSTEFNHIKWPEDRLINEIKAIDNKAHSGAEKHERNTPERNIVSVFNDLTQELMKRISQTFTSFKRVIVTADHGSTRLGVLAHNMNFSTTIKYPGIPDDWRYCKAIAGRKRPDEFVSGYANSTEYWVVRGYNRLPKSGGKLYEMHGGATLEETLVPFIIFERGRVEAIHPEEEKSAIQFVEKDDFDI